MFAAAPESMCGAAGLDVEEEKPSSLPEPLISLRGVLRLGSGQACEPPVATRVGVSSRDVAKCAPMPVVNSLDEISHWFRALQMLRRWAWSWRTTKRRK